MRRAPGGSISRVPSIPTGTTGRPVATATKLNAPETERPHSRLGIDPPFGEDEQRPFAEQRGEQSCNRVGRVVGAAPGDKDTSESTEKSADDRDAAELGARDEGHRLR